MGGTKLERFLHKNQHTQRKLLNFENWVNGEVSKIGHNSRKYRHSSISVVNVETQRKNCGSKNLVYRGYLVVLKGRKIG